MKGAFGESVIKVKRAKLLGRIQDNRNKHRDEFEQAWAGYEAAVREWFEKSIELIHAGKMPRVTAFVGAAPQDHTEDYDRVIDMLLMEIREDLEIDETQFAQYVRDDWSWKKQFIATNSTYSNSH